MAVIATDDVEGDPSDLYVKVLGVAITYQGQGYGAQALDVALTAAQTRASRAGHVAMTVSAKVHPRNEPSKSLMSAYGMDYTGVMDGPDLEVWDSPDLLIRDSTWWRHP